MAAKVKVTQGDFGTDRKPMCDFLSVNVTDEYCIILHYFWVIAAFSQIITFGRSCFYL